jgi:hypothetical protein
MRYYDLSKEGKVRGSYAVPQPDKELTLLDDAPNSESMWDGKAWVPDHDKLTTKAATDKRQADILTAKEAVQAISEDIKKATDLDSLKAVVLKLAEQVKILTGQGGRDLAS